MTRPTVLLAGATSALGIHLSQLLRARGHQVRALIRQPERLTGQPQLLPALVPALFDEVHAGDALVPATLAGACQGVAAVFSCLGASVDLSWGDRRAFTAVDTPANLNLLREAVAAGVGRFAYVSLFDAKELGRDLDYVRAHEEVVDALKEAALSALIIRPTGFFSALAALVPLAASGRLVEVGSAAARSNPIHDADLAQVCADALFSAESEVAVGGPEVLTRRQMAELAFAAVGRAPRLLRAPPLLLHLGASCLRPLNPRLCHLVRFFLAVSSQDLIAPARGRRRLSESLRTRALKGRQPHGSPVVARIQGALAEGAQPGFPSFQPLFAVGPSGVVSYLPLLHLAGQDEVSHAIAELRRSLQDSPDADAEQRALLAENNWRPHLLAAVALLLSGLGRREPALLWRRIDAGSWVAPQLLVTAYLADPDFLSEARRRLESSAITDRKALSALCALCRRTQPEWLAAVLARPAVADALAKDGDHGDALAECWLEKLLAHLPGAAPRTYIPKTCSA